MTVTRHDAKGRGVEAREQWAACLRLRREGLAYAEIASRLGISVSAAHGGVQRGLREIVREPAEGVLELEKQRLDELYERARRHLDSEDPELQLKAVMVALKVSERRAKMLGLNAPEQHEFHELKGLSDEQLQLRAQDVARRLLGQAAEAAEDS